MLGSQDYEYITYWYLIAVIKSNARKYSKQTLKFVEERRHKRTSPKYIPAQYVYV